MKKLPAFTLIELLITLILSGIVIGFGYGAYSMIFRQFSDYRVESKKTNDVLNFESVFKYDFAVSSTHELLEETRVILGGNDREVVYQWGKPGVLRIEKGNTDTFHLNLSRVSMSLFGNPVDTGEFDRIIFELEMNKGTKSTIEISRTYSAEELMSMEDPSILLRVKKEGYGGN
jgi:prepilin-type N-terminal cleavage/methylation domain-containing protein